MCKLICLFFSFIIIILWVFCNFDFSYIFITSYFYGSSSSFSSFGMNFGLEAFLSPQTLLVTNYSGPVFYYSPLVEVLVRNLNMWNHYSYMQDPEMRDFLLRNSITDREVLRLNKWQSYQGVSYIKDSCYKFDDFMIKKGSFFPSILINGGYIEQPFVLKDQYAESNDRIFRFSRKLNDLALFNFVLKNYDFRSSFFYPLDHGKLSSSMNYSSLQHYHSYKVLFLENKNLLSFGVNQDNLRNFLYFRRFFDNLNPVITALIQKDFASKSLFFKIESPQIKHLLTLSFNDIQLILWLMRNDERFISKSFLEVHWDLYSNTLPINYFSVGTPSSVKIFGLTFDIETLLHRFFEHTRVFFNPFNMQYNDERLHVISPSTKLLYFSEHELRGLPIHLLLISKQTVEIQPENFVTFNVFSNARINSFVEIFLADPIYSEKLISYLRNYGKFNRSIFNVEEGIGRRRVSYQRNYFVVINPWWECLTETMQQKFSHMLCRDFNVVDDYILHRNKLFFGDKKCFQEKFSLNFDEFFNEKKE